MSGPGVWIGLSLQRALLPFSFLLLGITLFKEMCICSLLTLAEHAYLQEIIVLYVKKEKLSYKPRN